LLVIVVETKRRLVFVEGDLGRDQLHALKPDLHRIADDDVTIAQLLKSARMIFIIRKRDTQRFSDRTIEPNVHEEWPGFHLIVDDHDFVMAVIAGDI